MKSNIESLVSIAKDGDKKALEELVLEIQDDIYGLALRMLYNPSDAEDASQEILLKIITNLGTFRGESSFSTWMYRVAANHLLTTRKHRAEREAMSFEEYELDVKKTADWRESQSNALNNLFIEEIRISCLQGLLLCLDREHRLAFLLVDVFDVSSEQGAAILDITSTAFRKRLSRARERIQDFLTRNCALINPNNPCKCEHYVNDKKFSGEHMVFAKHPCRIKNEESTQNRVREMDELNQIAALYKRYPDFHAPVLFIENIRELVRSKKYELL